MKRFIFAACLKTEQNANCEHNTTAIDGFTTEFFFAVRLTFIHSGHICRHKVIVRHEVGSTINRRMHFERPYWQRKNVPFRIVGIQ